MSFRDGQGRFVSTRKRKSGKHHSIIEHNYNAHGERTLPRIEKSCIGRRIVEMDVLCRICSLVNSATRTQLPCHTRHEWVNVLKDFLVISLSDVKILTAIT